MEKEEKKIWYKTPKGVVLAILILPFFAVWWIWKKTNWETQYKWGAIGVIALITIIGISGMSSSTNNQKVEIKNDTTKQQTSKEANSNSNEQVVNTPEDTKVEVPSITYSEYASYSKSSEIWKLIVLSKKPSSEEVKKVASELHSKDKTANYHLFDNGDQLEAYKNWDINYGKVIDKDGVAKQIYECTDVTYCSSLVKAGKYAYNAPEAWMNEHEIGLINQMYGDGGMKWQLSTLSGEKITDL